MKTEQKHRQQRLQPHAQSQQPPGKAGELSAQLGIHIVEHRQHHRQQHRQQHRRIQQLFAQKLFVQNQRKCSFQCKLYNPLQDIYQPYEITLLRVNTEIPSQRIVLAVFLIKERSRGSK